MSGLDKRYQVFISSTYEDLIPERQAIMQALLELDCIPSGMELFLAADDDQWTLIKRVIDDCDYYIVIIGGKYGSEGPTGISYTRMEYEYAVSKNKPVIAFLHKDITKIIGQKLETTEVKKGKLEAFRALAQTKMCKYWMTPDELGSVVSRSLVQLIKMRPAIGWVRANLVADESAAQEILKLRRKVEELQSLVPLEIALRHEGRSINYFKKLAEKYPRNALQEAWTHVENTLAYACETHGLRADSMPQQLSFLRAHGEITTEEVAQLGQFHVVSNHAKSTNPFPMSRDAVVGVIEDMLKFTTKLIENCDGVWSIRKDPSIP